MERETPKDGNDVGEALTAPNPVVIRQQKKRDYMRLWRERLRSMAAYLEAHKAPVRMQA